VQLVCEQCYAGYVPSIGGSTGYHGVQFDGYLYPDRVYRASLMRGIMPVLMCRYPVIHTR